MDRIVNEPAPTTAPVPIVAVLRGTPFQAPVQAAAKSEDEARMILDLAVDLGVLMLRAGSGSSDVEVSVIATCTAMGLPNAEVDLTSTALTVHYADPDNRLLTVMRVSRESSPNYAKLASIHRLVYDMVNGKLNYTGARERFDAIGRQRRPYPEWVTRTAWGVMVAAVINLMGGGLLSSALGFGMAVIADYFGSRVSRLGVPVFFVIAAQAIFATFVAMFAYTADIVHSPQYVVAGGIVLLLPTQTLFSAVHDALTNFPLTAAGRTVMLMMGFGGIVSGVALGLMLGRALDLNTVQVLVNSGGSRVVTAVISLIAAFVVTFSSSVAMQVNRRFVLPASLIGFIGFLTYTSLTVAGFGNIVTCLVGATVVGFLTRVIAERISAPAVALYIPAVFPLLQGMSVFAAVYSMVSDAQSSLSVGLSSLFAAVTANAALAVGVVLGMVLAQPLRKRVTRRASQPPVNRA